MAAIPRSAQLSVRQFAKFTCRLLVEKGLAENKLAKATSAAEKRSLAARSFALADVLLWLELARANDLVGYPPELEGFAKRLVVQKYALRSTALLRTMCQKLGSIFGSREL